MKPGLSSDRLPALVFLAMPVVVVGPALGPRQAPGQDTEMLAANLVAGAQLRSMLTGGVAADAALGPGPGWPENLSAALWQAAVGSWFDSGLTYGLLLAVAVTLAGFGPYRLARSWWPDAPLGGAITAGLLVQISPPVLRGASSGEIGVLAVGLVALALSARRPWSAALLALLAGGWSAAAALTVGLCGVARRRPAWVLALAPLGVALAFPPSALPGASRVAAPTTATLPGADGETMAVPSRPPDERTGSEDALAPGARAAPDGGARPSPARLPGGLGIWAAGALGLAVGRRKAAGLALVLLLGWTAVFGLLPVPGAPPPIPLGWLVELGLLVPGLRPPVGALAWLAPALLAAGLAVVTVPRPLLLVAIGVGATLLENPSMVLSVTRVAADPALGLPAPGPAND